MIELDRRRARWVLALVVLAATVLYAWFALRVRTVQPDEGLHVGLARWLPTDLPSSAVALDPYVRGIQRLYVFVLAIPLGLFASPTDWELARVMDALLFSSTAIPAYLLARAVGVARLVALGVAALSVLMPIGLVATAFLTEVLAYPVTIWALWAMWRAIDRPAPGRDLAVLVLIALAALTRSNLALIGGAYAAAALLQAWRFPRPGAGGLARRVWRGHPFLVVVVAAGLLVLVLTAAGAISLTAILGDRAPTGNGLGEAISKLVQRLTRTAVATGLLPAIVALPWAVRELARPTDRVRHAFAAVAVLTIAAILLSSIGTGLDERYCVYLVPPILVAAVLGMSRERPLSTPVLCTMGTLLGFAIGISVWEPDRAGAYSAFTYPAETAWARLVDGPLGGGLVAAVVCTLGGGWLGWMLGATINRRDWQTFGLRIALVVTAVVALATTLSSLSRFDDAVGGPFVPRQLAFLDEHAGADGRSALLINEAGTLDPLAQRLDAERAFNSTLDTVVSLDQPFSFTPPVGLTYVLAGADDRTGALLREGDLPRTIGVPRGYVRVGLAGDVVARSTLEPYDTLRLSEPPRARFRVDGAQSDGSLAPGTDGVSRAEVIVWTFGLGAGRCLSVPLAVAPGGDVPRTIELRAPGVRRRAELPPGAAAVKRVPLDVGRADDGRLTVRIEARGYGDVGGRIVAAQLGALSVAPCG